MDLQYDVVNYTPADASPVDSNFNRIQQYINTDLINKDGTVAMTAQLQLVGNPIAALDAAPKQYVDTFVPIGSILMFGGSSAPAGGQWALCNGADLAQSDFPGLFAIIGVTYGGSGGHFNLPNLSGKFPIGQSATDALATTGGNRNAVVVNHTHSVDHAHPVGTTGNDNQSHTHPGQNHAHAFSGTTGAMDRSANHAHYMRGIGTTSVAGGFGEGNVSDISNGSFGPAFNTSDNGVDHLHGFSGTTSGVDRDITTGGINNNHNHNFQTPTFSGASGNPAGGVVATNTNMPPYLSINFIIRCA
jgi:microcystin-dependent protein